MKKKSIEIELNWFCSHIQAISLRTRVMHSVSFIETLGDTALGGLQSPHLPLHRFALASSGPHPSATGKYFAVRGFTNMFFCSVPFSTATVCLHLQRDTLYLYLAAGGILPQAYHCM